MKQILAIGMSNTDLVCRTTRLPRAGETVAGSTFNTFAGGKGANQAVAASRAGAQVAFIGAVGDDQYGADRLSDLEAEEIAVHGVQVLQDVDSGIALIIVDDAGENQIVTVAGANALVDPMAAIETLRSSTCDTVLMSWELEPGTSIALVKAVPEGVPVLINTAPFNPSVRNVLPRPDVVLIANEVEASELLGWAVDLSNAIDAANQIRSLGCKGVVITLGAAGAIGVTADHRIHVSPPEVDVVDTTGAGDTFCGAFAAWLTNGSSFEEAIRAGVHAGALATTVAGAQPSIPVRDRILESLDARQ